MQSYPKPEARTRQIRPDTPQLARSPAYHRPYASLDLQRGPPSSHSQSFQPFTSWLRPDPYHHHPLVSTERLPFIRTFPPPRSSFESLEFPQAARPSIRDDIINLGLDRAVAPLRVPLAGSPNQKKRRPTPLRPSSLLSTPSLSPNVQSPLSSSSMLSAASPDSQTSSIASLPNAPLPSPQFVEFGAVSPRSHGSSTKRSASRATRRSGMPIFPVDASRPQSPAIQLSVRTVAGHGDGPADFPRSVPELDRLPSSARRQSSPSTPSSHLPTKQSKLKFRASFTIKNFFSCSDSKESKERPDGKTKKKKRYSSSTKGGDKHTTVVAIEGSTQDMKTVIPKLRQLKMPKTKQR